MNKIPSEIWTKNFNYLLKFSKSLIIVLVLTVFMIFFSVRTPFYHPVCAFIERL